MGASSILARLLMDTKDYDSKLKRAKQSSESFGKEIGGAVAGAVGKFAAGVGLAMGGVEAFNTVLNSTQTTGDAWANTMNACKGTVDAFFRSLASGDWNAFEGGLSRLMGKMKEVSALQDMLADAKLTMGFDIRGFEKEYVRLEGIIDDEKLGKDEREKAYQDMEKLIAKFRERVEKTGAGAAETLTKELGARFNLEFTMDDVKTFISEVNNEFLDTETLRRLNKYKDELAKFEPGRSRMVDGYVMTADQYKARNQDLEKLRVLQDDNDKNRKEMVGAYEYVLELLQKAEEYHKRSLKKQNKVTRLQKEAASAGGGTTSTGKTAGAGNDVSVAVVPQVQYDTPLGKKVLEWMNGGELPILKLPIEVEAEEPDEEDLSGKWEEHTKRIEKMNEALANTGDLFGGLGSLAGGLGSEMGAWMMNSMGQVAQMIAQMNALKSAEAAEAMTAGVGSAAKLPFPANLAAIATVVATIASVLGSLPKFADGGIVGGGSFVGDKLLARVNSGEMILNQKQQSRLLRLTDGGEAVRVSGDVRLQGKDLYIALRNYLRTSGAKW